MEPTHQSKHTSYKLYISRQWPMSVGYPAVSPGYTHQLASPGVPTYARQALPMVESYNPALSAQPSTPSPARLQRIRKPPASRATRDDDDDDFVESDEDFNPRIRSSPAPRRASTRRQSSVTNIATESATDDRQFKLQQCKQLLTKLKRHKNAWPFKEPVDPVALDIPDYPEVIKNPMDLGTIWKKLQDGQYNDASEVLADLDLVWSNCLLYNPPGNAISDWAIELRNEHKKMAKQLGIMDSVGGEDPDDDYVDDQPAQEVRSRPSYATFEQDTSLLGDDDDYEDVGSTRSRRASARLSARGNTKRYFEDDDDEWGEGGEEKKKRRRKSGGAGAGDAEDDEDEEESEESSEEEDDAAPKQIVEKILAHRTKQLSDEEFEKKKQEREERINLAAQKKLVEEEAAREEERKVEGDEVAKARLAQKRARQAKAKAKEKPKPEEEEVSRETYEFLVKFKEMAYIHCEWVSQDSIEAEGPAGRGKLNRYWKKRNDLAREAEESRTGMLGEEEEPPFPPQYCEIERIIACETYIAKINPDDPSTLRGTDVKLEIVKLEEEEESAEEKLAVLASTSGYNPAMMAMTPPPSIKTESSIDLPQSLPTILPYPSTQQPSTSAAAAPTAGVPSTVSTTEAPQPQPQPQMPQPQVQPQPVHLATTQPEGAPPPEVPLTGVAAPAPTPVMPVNPNVPTVTAPPPPLPIPSLPPAPGAGVSTAPPPHLIPPKQEVSQPQSPSKLSSHTVQTQTQTSFTYYYHIPPTQSTNTSIQWHHHSASSAGQMHTLTVQSPAASSTAQPPQPQTPQAQPGTPQPSQPSQAQSQSPQPPLSIAAQLQNLPSQPPAIQSPAQAQLWEQVRVWKEQMMLNQYRQQMANHIQNLKVPASAASPSNFPAMPMPPPSPREKPPVIKRKEVVLGPDERLVTRYLVKWCDLPYTDCTWEFPEDLKDDMKIADFHRWNTPPARYNLYRPAAGEWRPLTDPKFKDDNKLRSYQLEGLNWLIYCWYNRRGSILADEMGLGKTVQSISFLEHLNSTQQIHGPFLVVCPLSTMPHWTREFEGWTDMNVLIYQGNEKSRDMIRQYEFYYATPTYVKGQDGKTYQQTSTRRNSHFKFNVILTTYEMILRSDWAELSKIPWKALVVDEAHRLKNRTSKLLERLKLFKTEHRVILTGTPLQNNTEELWTLLNFIDPHLFNSLPLFLQNFGNLQDAEQVTKLHLILRPHLLRRLKEDVENSIPPKEEVVVEVELTSTQKKYYRAILERNRDFLNKGCQSGNVPNLINVVMQLRKVCNHPYMIPGVEEKESVVAKTPEEYYKVFIQSAGKLALLDKLLPKLHARGNKVLVFSQMVRVLDLLESYLRYHGWFYERLDGRIRGNERQAAIDRFSKPGSNRFIFLLCTRAGGVGINLAAADTVIIYDSDWNPQNDVQAQARCHRIGQTKEVKVYRLITRNTYERHMFERTSKKLGLDQAVLDNLNSTGTDAKTKKEALAQTGKEINDLLKYGAYDLFRDDEEGKASGDMYNEDDIDKILERSSTLVRYDKPESEGGDRRSSTFSKAVFQSSQADSGIDINAENFWELVLPEAKDAGSLLGRLRAGKVAESEEKQDKFWEELTAAVEECLAQWNKGHGTLPKDLHILTGIMEEILDGNSGVNFSADRLAQATQWSTMLTRSRRRRRGDVSGAGVITGRRSRRGAATAIDDADGAYQEDSASDSEGRKRRRGGEHEGPQTKKKKSGPRADFNMSERKRLQESLFAYARPAWKDIKQRARLDKRTHAEVRSYALAFITQCVNYAAEEDKAFWSELKQFLRTDAAKYGMTDEELEPMSDGDDAQESELGRGKRSSARITEVKYASLKDANYVQNIKRKSKAWVKRLIIIKRLRIEIERTPTLEEFSLPARWPTGRRQQLAAWWGTQEDRDLLVGSYVHGYGCVDAMFADPSLCFMKNNRKLSSVLASANLGKVTPLKPSPSSSSSKSKSKGKSKAGSKSGGSSASKGTRQQPPRRASSSASLAVNDEEEEEEGGLNIDEEEGGGGDGEEAEGGGDGAEESKQASIWPAKRVLSLRVKTALDLIDRLRKAEERIKDREEKMKDKLETKKRKQDQLELEREERVKKRTIKIQLKQQKNEERQREWSKRERGDFRTALMAYGPGKWDLIKDKARLTNKGIDALRYYYKELMAYARQMVREYPNPYENFGKKKDTSPAKPAHQDKGKEKEKYEKEMEEGEKEQTEKGKENEGGGEQEKEKDKDDSRDEDSKELEIDEKEEKEEKEEKQPAGAGDEAGETKDGDSGSEDAPTSATRITSPDNKYMLSIITAHRLVDRINLWLELREKVLPNAELGRRIERASRGKMPEWWIPGEHDLALLRAVDRCGIGNNGETWDAFLEDNNCPFYRQFKGAKVTRKQVQAFILKFIEDRSPINNRIKYYCNLVLRPHVLTGRGKRPTSGGEEGGAGADGKQRQSRLNFVPVDPSHYVEGEEGGEGAYEDMEEGYGDEGDEEEDDAYYQQEKFIGDDGEEDEEDDDEEEDEEQQGGSDGGRSSRRSSRRSDRELYTKSYRTGGRDRKKKHEDDGSGGDEEAENGEEEEAAEQQQQYTGREEIVPKVPRDEQGQPILPLTVKNVTILSLGRIISNRPSWHSKQYLWPAGFKSVRKLGSMKDSQVLVNYYSEIIDSDNAPVFQVTAEDMPDEPFTSNTPTAVWIQVLRKIKRKSVSVSGPEMFGYSMPVVRMLFQELPGARRCSKYSFVAFREVESEDAGSVESASTHAEEDVERDDNDNDEEDEEEAVKETPRGGMKRRQSARELQLRSLIDSVTRDLELAESRMSKAGAGTRSRSSALLDKLRAEVETLQDQLKAELTRSASTSASSVSTPSSSGSSSSGRRRAAAEEEEERDDEDGEDEGDEEEDDDDGDEYRE